jgi:DNA polymerase-3 subunit delta
VWGVKERLYERILPRASDAQLARLLQSAHQVDGIVKGLKQPDWPAHPWQALQRLAFQLARLGAAAR